MRLSYPQLIGSLLVTAMVVTGCRCGPPDIKRNEGEIGIEYLKGGLVLTDRNALYDFGGVFRGQRSSELSIVVRNLGTAPLTLSSLELVEGDEFVLGAAPATDATASYYVEFEPGTEVAPAETLVIPLTFVPPEDPENSASKTHLTKLLLRTGGTFDLPDTDEDETIAYITITGDGISGQCEIPAKIDFGTVARGDTVTRAFVIQNPSDLPATATVGDIASGSTDRFAFDYVVGSPRGDVQVEPKTNKNVTIQFKPTEAKNYFARAEVRAAKQCPVVQVELTGVGVDQVLSWSPQSVDCGAVTPGFEITRQITFTNLGGNTAELDDIQFTRYPNEFRRIVEAGQNVRKLTVPGNGGTAVMNVGCKPGGLGTKTDTLTFKTTLARQPNGSIGVKVFGGGPDIHVSPSPTLNFGKVAYFPGEATQASQERKLTVENRGTKPTSSSGTEYNLRLGTSASNYTEGFVEIVPANADTQPSEFEFVMPSSYNPATGLGATAADNAMALTVKFSPKSVGIKAARITIHSNDPDEQSVSVNITAEATLLNPCNFSVVPDPTLNFGLVTPGDYRDQNVIVTNLATGTNARDVCLISGIRLSNNGGNIYSLPYGDVTDSQEIQPGQSYPIVVRVRPTGTAGSSVSEVTGELEFYMSVKDTPRRTVDLVTAVGQACLSIAPDDWNFGTVQVGCRSSTQQFRLYNSCPAAVTLRSVTMQNAAGQQVGGPQCDTARPGYSACPEFLITQQDTIPGAGLTLSSGGTPFNFRGRYEPLDYTTDTGAIAIQATQNGQDVTYLVTLRGRGDTQGYNEDVFSQEGNPKSDILIVLDSSCSMGTYQKNFGANFAAFINYATAQGVDYHIGVVTTEPKNSSTSGQLVSAPNHPEKWITPSTANKELKFAAKVEVGTTGSATETCLEPALAALTPPLITGYNAGFLRDEATLAILCVTDARDQTSQTAPYFLNQFLNVKGFNRATDFTFNAIAGFQVPAPCSYDSGPDDGKLDYMVRQTNGSKGEICTTDWRATLEEVGKKSFGFRTTFFLTAHPDQANGVIQVYVEGEEVPKRDPDRNTLIWSYDPVQNAVVFDPNYAPQAGDALTVTYTVACNPS